MTVSVLGITTSDSVRSTLGVMEEAELPDEVFDDFGVADLLELDLSEWLPEAHSYPVLVAMPQSALNRRRQIMLESYSKFYCAYLLSLSSSSWLNKQISDGQNVIQRFDSDGSLSDSMLSHASRYKLLLLGTLTTTVSKSAPLSLFSSASPSYDPITGESS